MIPHAVREKFRSLPPEVRRHLRRVGLLMLLAAALGVALALALPPGHHR